VAAAQDRRVLKRINQLIQDVIRNGNEGIGKPEPLKHDFAGYWSRRDSHRQPSCPISDIMSKGQAPLLQTVINKSSPAPRPAGANRDVPAPTPASPLAKIWLAATLESQSNGFEGV
jgi:YoeB-like toxin of bacterial type II toxin-antitoxin system